MNSSSLSKRPAVRVVGLFIAGILVSVVVHSEPSTIYFAIVGCAMAMGVAHWRKSAFPWVSLFLHAVLLLLGLLLGLLRKDQIENDILSPGTFGEHVVSEGSIESEPIKKGNRSEMVIRTSIIRRHSAEIPASRRILVYVARKSHWTDPDSLAIGDRVRISGVLESLPGARNPGEFDYGRYLALNGIQGFVTVRDTSSIVLLSRSESFSFSDLAGRAQKNIYRVFDRYHGQREASFLKGVVFGYRGDLTAEVKQAFMDTGTIHILAVSGSNVVVVAMIFYSLVGFFRVSSRVGTALTLVGLLWYMVITGLSPSVVRATIMAGSILIGTVLGRRGDIYNSLAFAALVMLIWDPLILMDVGFQLSFAAVISIVYFYPKLELLIESLPGKFFRFKLVNSALKLFAVSIAAQLGTIPFTAYFFGRVSLISVLANLVVVPVSGLNTLLGFATLGATFISGWCASCYAALNDLLVSLLLEFVMWSASVPFAYVETLGIGAIAAITYYAVVAALFNVHNPRLIVKAICGLLLMVNMVVYAEMLNHSENALKVTVIDVGQGDAILLEFPNGRRVMLDTGPTFGQSDVGQKIIAPYLKKCGIRFLDAIVLSHPHDDHIGGCRSLLRDLSVGSLIVADTAPVTKSYAALLEFARGRRIPIQIVRAGERLQFDASTRIFVLHPGSALAGGDLNNSSLVLKVCYGTTSMILPGDASLDVEGQLQRSCSFLLASDVLKVAHHGASTSSGEQFLTSVRPSLAAISVGRMNKFKHPSPVVLTRYRYLGIPTTRTDLDGAVVLQSDGSRFRVVPWRRSSVL